MMSSLEPIQPRRTLDTSMIGALHGHAAEQRACLSRTCCPAPWCRATACTYPPARLQVTTEELFTRLHLLGTRATKTELKSMISQIDNDGDKKVDFEEFVVFLVFCFFDENGNGEAAPAGGEGRAGALTGRCEPCQRRHRPPTRRRPEWPCPNWSCLPAYLQAVVG